MLHRDRPGASVAFPALDSLRAVAAVAVLATHAAFWAGAYAHPVYGTALSRLDVGVAVFFVLSGFLLSRPWIARHRAGLPPPSTTHYLWKRALRLVPVYVVTVVAALTLLPGNRGAGVGQWLTTLLLANIYVDDSLPDGLTQMWSLSTEVAFYLVLPVLMGLALSRTRGRRGDRIGLLALAMTATSVVWLMDLSVRWDGGGTMIRLWLPSYLVWFAVGILLASYDVRSREDRNAATPLAGPPDLTPTTLGAALTKNVLYAGIAGFVILPGIFAPPESRLVRVLTTPALRHVGQLSYGIFCVHLLLLELIAEWRDMPLFGGRGLELFVLTLAASLVVSELLHRVVERPALRLRDVWPLRSRSTATSAPSETATSSWGSTSAPAHPSDEPSGRHQ